MNTEQAPVGARTAEEVRPGISIDAEIAANKELRRDLDIQLQKLKGLPPTRHRALAITHLEDSIMRLGMDLKRIAEEHPNRLPNPYPNSKDPSNTVIDKTADNLKL